MENPGKIYYNLVSNVRDYLEKAGLKSMVLGISGGIDSTVVASICHRVSEQSGIPLYGVSLMSTTNESAEKDVASLVGKAFCDNGATYFSANIQGIYENVSNFCSSSFAQFKSTNISEGNIKARLRMIALYNLASETGGLVMDTDNLTEHYLGFFTIHGDVADLNPIGELWKHEVYELAKWIKNHATNTQDEREALEESIRLTPTDGNGVMAGGDLEQIAPGRTYEEVDEMLSAIVNRENIGAMVSKYGNSFEKVHERYVKSMFKRQPAPVVVKSGKFLIY